MFREESYQNFQKKRGTTVSFLYQCSYLNEEAADSIDNQNKMKSFLRKR